VDTSIKCNDDGVIEVTLGQGTAQHYVLRKEVPEGSGTFVDVAGPQDGGEISTIFENLTPGHYRVVITDQICQTDVVYTVFLDELVFPDPEAGNPELTPVLDDCVTASVGLVQPIQIPLAAFPVTITITVYPPDYPATPAVEIVLEDVEASGTDDPQVIDIEESIPYYIGTYHY